MARSKYALKTSNLTLLRRDRTVINNINLNIHSGEIYGLIGKNGAGKSSLMKILCGMIPQSSGTYEILGTEMKPAGSHTRVGSLIERPGFYAELSGLDNVICRGLALGLVDPRKAAKKVLNDTGMAEVAHELAARYSLGMKQRLGIALALVGSPELIILDEPFNGVDIEGTLELKKLFVNLAAYNNSTILISSHVPEHLAHLVTHYAIMAGGHITCVKTASEVSRECSSRMYIHSPTIEVALAVLEEAYPDKVIGLNPEGTIEMDTSPGTSNVTQSLWNANIEVTDVYIREGDFARYFVDLMSGSNS